MDVGVEISYVMLNIGMNEIEYNCIGDWGEVTSNIPPSEYVESDAV